MRVSANAKRRPPAQVAVGVPLPAPVGGWDGISPLANMPTDRAVNLDNWIPRPGWIEPRHGYVLHSTVVSAGSGTPVQTVMAYNGQATIQRLFAVAAGTIYDCTNKGAAVATSVTGLASSRLQHVMFSGASGVNQYLITVNGTDAPKIYDGTVWTTPVYTVATTGLPFDPTTFSQVASWKNRLWFVQKDSTNVVYLETVYGIQGAASAFPLGSLMSKGGKIVAIGTWTVDTNQLVDEYIAFITSRGQVIVYYGTDPSTAGTFNLLGIYNLGAPIGERCFCRIAGDLLIITVDGVVPMTKMLTTDRSTATGAALTATIMNPMNLAAQLYKNNFGWQMIEYAKGTIGILNIPIEESFLQMQFVVNTITGAWCRFYDRTSQGGIPANCWEVDSSDNIYFGGNNGAVYQYDISSLDSGAPINCYVATAYNSFENAAQIKRYTMLQPLITTTGTPIPQVGINIDFNQLDLFSQQQPILPDYPKWGQVKWDQFKWPVLQTSQNNWISVDGVGHYVSIITQITTVQPGSDPAGTVLLQLNGWNITAEKGAFV